MVKRLFFKTLLRLRGPFLLGILFLIVVSAGIAAPAILW